MNVKDDRFYDTLGFYQLSWGEPQPAPTACDFTVAFSGWPDIPTALENSATIFPGMTGKKFLSLGGGAETGRFTANNLQANLQAIGAGAVDEYDGVCFDIEVCDAGLESTFEQCFALLKGRGKGVFVTVSHSAPYEASDAATLMTALLASHNIDTLSPQMYTTGSENAPVLDPNWALPWSAWADAVPAIAPSVAFESHYPAVVSFMLTVNPNMNIVGCCIWNTKAP